MRIVILANADIGLYKFRRELIQRLCIENEVFIVLPDGEFINELVDLGCSFIEFDFKRRGMNPLADMLQIRRYKALIRKLSPDVVLTYTIKPNVYGGIACQMCGVPYIANITGLGTAMENGGILSLITTSLYRAGLKKAECVFFQNKDNLEYFESKGIFHGRTRLIPGSGVNLEMHNPERYPDDENEFRFLFVGRIMKDKGIEELLYSVRKLHEQEPEVILEVVGWCDEDYFSSLNEASEEGYIRYYGTQTNVHPFYSKCHCAVLPSYHEGMANVMLEASATGRPVITTRVPGCRETFDEGSTGIGCDAKDKDSLFDAMNAMISLPREDREKMGVNARKKMEREFDRQIVIDSYLQELKTLSK